MAGISQIKSLPKRKMQAIVALLGHKSVGEAAHAIGISETTLYRWLRNPTFQDTYRAAKYEVVQQALAQLQQSCGEAPGVLREIMNDSSVPPYTRVIAARTILETSIKAVELDTLEARITKLEEFIQEQKSNL